MKKQVFGLIAAASLVVALALNFNSCLALGKCALGTSKLLSGAQRIEISLDGECVAALLQPLPGNRLRLLNGGVEKRPCCILLAEDGRRFQPLKIGYDWVGGFSYGGANLARFGRWLAVSETANMSYDLRDSVKGQGDSYSIGESDGLRFYSISMRGSHRLELKLSDAQIAILLSRRDIAK